MNEDKWPKLPRDYDMRFIYEKMGYNLGPLELQAAMGRVQLKRTNRIKKLRKANFNFFLKHLVKYPELLLPAWDLEADVCWFAFPLSTRGERGPLVAHLEKNGIETRSMFSGNILLHPAYENVEHRSMLTKGSDCNWILKHSFFFGVHPRMDRADREYVLSVFKSYYGY